MGGEDRERIAIGAGSLGDCVFFVQRVPFSPRIIVAEMGAGNMGQWANSFCGISAILDSGFLVFAVRFFGCCAFCCGFIKVLVARGVVFFRPSIFLSFIPGFSCLPFFWAAPDSGRAPRSIGVSSRSSHCAQSAHSLSVVLVLVLLLDTVLTFPYVPSLHFFPFLSSALPTCEECPFDR